MEYSRGVAGAAFERPHNGEGVWSPYGAQAE